MTSEKRFVWEGPEVVQERNGGNSLITRYYAEGFVYDNGSYGYPGYTPPKIFYTRDHLGSIRDVRGPNGSSHTEYDIYGRATSAISGYPPHSADFGYTGHYHHGPSGLTLAPYRAYDATLGRWLNRDPIEEEGGLNLYGYVLNDPVNLIDPLGLDAQLILQREGGNRSAGTLHIYEDGTYRGSTPANLNGLTPKRQGVIPGTYSVLPKREDGISFPRGQPAVTDPRYPSQPRQGGPGLRRRHDPNPQSRTD